MKRILRAVTLIRMTVIIFSPAIQHGDIKVETIDEKVRRILRTAISFGWFDRDQMDFTISAIGSSDLLSYGIAVRETSTVPDVR